MNRDIVVKVVGSLKGKRKLRLAVAVSKSGVYHILVRSLYRYSTHS